MLHENQPLEFPSLMHQEAVTAKQASKVLQFKQQMARDPERRQPSFRVAGRLLGARHGARHASKLERTSWLGDLGQVPPFL